jgi:2-oxoglutarate dehydrogenase E1 component
LIKNGQLNIDASALRNSNMALICCSNASNLFHAMRRQLRRDYRKPLINFVNKKLLKLKEAGTTFA